jgi:hypothetical protein
VSITPPPMVIHSLTTLTTQEQFVIGPSLKLINNIIFNTQTPIILSTAQTEFINQANLHIQYILEQGASANLNSSSTMPANSNMAVAGFANMSMGCYLDPDISMSRIIEISATITAQKSRTRIVAQGNLVRKYE